MNYFSLDENCPEKCLDSGCTDSVHLATALRALSACAQSGLWRPAPPLVQSVCNLIKITLMCDFTRFYIFDVFIANSAFHASPQCFGVRDSFETIETGVHACSVA